MAFTLNKIVEYDELVRDWRKFKFNSIGKYISSSQLPCMAFSDKYTNEEVNSIINRQLEFYKSLYENDIVKITVEQIGPEYNPTCMIILS